MKNQANITLAMVHVIVTSPTIILMVKYFKIFKKLSFKKNSNSYN